MKAQERSTGGGAPVVEKTAEGVLIIRLGAENETPLVLTEARLNGLEQIIDLARTENPKGVVITGPGLSMFSVGADINVIGSVNDAGQGEELARRGQEIFSKIEKLPCTTVAAIAGPCLGGGCELALSCNYRLLNDDDSTMIGLPEVKIGILPGFGGTQRLPRLIGLPAALDIILAGKTKRSKQALKIGLADEVVSSEKLLERAVAIASGEAKPKTRKLPLMVRFLTGTGVGRFLVNRKVKATLQKQTKGFYPAPPAALECTLYGLNCGMQKGFELEAKELGRLITTPECKSLVHVFFLTEASKRIGKGAKGDVEHLHGIVIGAGIMGAGIAGVMARKGGSVILRDQSEQGLERGIQQIQKSLEKSRSLSEADRNFILNRIERAVVDSPNYGNATIAIEAIFEDLDLKKKILGDLSKIIPREAIIASNTSSLSISDIATAIENPGRVVGMHFFNPVDRMPLIEIIRGKQTSDKTVVITAALATKLGKFPIVVDDVPGFLMNRILSPYLNEAGYLLEEGYSIRDIDRAAVKFGMPMGPIRLLDEVGLDVIAHVSEIMEKGYGERMKSLPYAKKLVDQGRKGKKSGSGFYQYAGKTEIPSSNIRSLLGISGLEKPNADIQEIEARLLYAMINEAVRCLDEGVAGTPGPDAASQIDLGSVMGFGFPPFRGGLLRYADTVGAKAICEKLQSYEKEHGVRYKPAEGLVDRAKNNGKFS